MYCHCSCTREHGTKEENESKNVDDDVDLFPLVLSTNL